MRGPHSHTQLPEFDLTELSLTQLATMSNDLAALAYAAPDGGTVEAMLESLAAALSAEIQSRPAAEFAGVISFMLRMLDRPTRRPTPPAEYFQRQSDRSMLDQLRLILSPGEDE